MPIYTIAEFAKATGKKAKDLHTYAGRGKLIKSEDRKIDTSNPINQLFYELNKVDTTGHIETPPKTKGNNKKKVTKKNDQIIPQEQSELVNLTLEKKRLEVRKLTSENEIKEVELKQKRGESLDADKTINIVKTYSDNLKKEYSQQIQILIQDICARHGVQSDKAGEYKLRVNDIVNTCSKKSVQILKDLDNVK